MIRRTLLTVVLAAAASIVALGARPATFVLTNGERVSGELTYKGGANFTLNGRDYSPNEVAIISFVPGDPNPAELRALPDSDNPPEHERHLFVMRDGSVVHGKLYHLSPDGETIQYDPRGTTGVGDRRSVSAGQVARIYINPRGARNVYASLLSSARETGVGTAGVAAPGAITVQANQPWTDTGITVKKGDRLSFHATGQIEIAPGTAATPDGFGADTGARNLYPVAAMPAGGLIARVGNGAPFPIGSNSQPITMPANGRLYLGINDSNFGDNNGAFAVSIVR